MKARLIALLAVCLVALGAVGDHLLSAGMNQSSPAVAASTSTTSSSFRFTSAPASSANSFDQATEHAYAVVSPSIVYIVSQGVGSGSGVIYDSQGDIVTNNHVISGASSLSVTLSNGKTYTAHVVGTDAADDLAVLKINASGLTPAQFASAGSYQVAQNVLAVGSPLGLKQSVTSGLISGLHRVEQEPNGAYLSDAIQTSAPINPGNSGGALVTLDGTVVGMPTLQQTGTQNGSSAQDIGFAIPSERITLIANQIITSGKVTHTGRPYLGIAPSDTSGQSDSPFFGGGGFGPSTTTTSGAVVQTLAPNGPAAQAGVQQGDVITAINGTTVTDAQDLLTYLATQKPGNTVTLKLDRNGSSTTVQVHLGELPASS